MRSRRSRISPLLSSPVGLVLLVMVVIAAPVLVLGELSASDAHARVEQRDLAATADAATQAAGLINVHLSELAAEVRSIARADALLAVCNSREWAAATTILLQDKAAASSDIDRLFIFAVAPLGPISTQADMATVAEYPASDRLGQRRPASDYAGAKKTLPQSQGLPAIIEAVARVFVANHADGPATVAVTASVNVLDSFPYALAADIPLARVTAWLAPMGDTAQRIYVMDESGALVSGGFATPAQSAALRRDPIVLAGSSNLAVARGTDPLTGSSRLLAASPLDSSSWTVVVSRETSAGLAELDAIASQQRLLRIGLVVALLLGTILVGRLTQRLQRQGVALELASRHKSEFLANMSHELRTPLNAVIGFSDVLLQRMFGELNERQTEYVTDIREAGRHQLALVNDILDLSKVEAGRMELEPSDFSLPALIGDAVALLRERASRSGVTLVVADSDSALGSITADERKIKQVLFNLIVNAIKFTPRGGSVTVGSRREATGVSVSVTDTGIGIAPGDQSRIFEEFQQAAGAAGRATEGTGLGLSLAKRFVELHGGTIRVESEPGRGARFVFVLPQTTTAA